MGKGLLVERSLQSEYEKCAQVELEMEKFLMKIFSIRKYEFVKMCCLWQISDPT